MNFFNPEGKTRMKTAILVSTLPMERQKLMQKHMQAMQENM